MRKTVITIVVVAAVLAGFFAWPFFGLYDLGRAMQSRDVGRIERHVDFTALGRSLSAQIMHTYARIAGLPVERGGLIASLASAVADPLVARLLTRVALAQLLQEGWPKEVLGEPPPEVTHPDWNALGNAWQIYANCEFGLGEFRVRIPVSAPRERQFRVELALRGWSWKLTGLELPQELQDHLARELIRQQGKPS
jgi:hypothetical protein